MSGRHALAAGGLLAVAVGSCAEPTGREVTGQPAEAPEVVAVYDQGSVTLEDLDRAILALPPGRRGPGSGETAGEWRAGLIRELVIDRLLAAEAELLGSFEDPELRSLREETRRQALMEVYLERHLPAAAEISEEELRRHYGENRERYRRPARRLVSHLFKRRGPGVEVAALKEEVAALRRQLLAGAGFGRLASEHSDSETRHRQGSLGWLSREQLPAELARTIFSLPERVPSQPLVTAEGVHLFQVELAVEAEVFDFAEVAAVIRRQLELERQQQEIERLAAGLPLPPGSFAAEPGELQALLAGGEPATPVLRIADYEISLARFRALLASRVSPDPAQRPAEELAPHLLASLERRERIYRHALAERLFEDPEVKERSARLESRALLDRMRQRSLGRRLDAEPERLQEYYERNRLRFATPLRLEVRRLTVPIEAPTADRTMKRLEQIAADRGSSTSSARLAAAAAELGGQIEALGWRTVTELVMLSPVAAALVAGLEPGELAPPYRGTLGLEMLEVTGRQEPAPPPFVVVLEQVRNRYLADHGPELYRDWAEERLEASGLRIFHQRLDPAPVP